MLKLQKFIEKYKQNADIWNNLLGAGLSVIGIIISICLAIINPSNVIIAAAVITCQLIVLVFSLACYHIIAQSKKTIEENNRQVEQNNILCQQHEKELSEMLVQKDKFIEKLAIFEKSINKRINNQ